MSQYKTLGSMSNYYPQNQNDPFVYLFNISPDASFITGISAKGTGADSKNYRSYMSDRCSIQGWDGYCEAASIDKNIGVPYEPGDYMAITYNNLNQGELLVKSTAEKKFISGTTSTCKPNVQQFDLRMASSPFVASISDCTKFYDVDEKTIDKEPVMDKLIFKPEIAPAVLYGIYKTRKNTSTFEKLKGTKLYNFYMSPRWQEMMKNVPYMKNIL